MNFAKIIKTDVCNGPGCRVSLFVSGCSLNCQGCFNKPAQDFRYGQLFTTSTVDEILSSCQGEHISGLSLLGGDVFEKKNVEIVAELVSKFRVKFGSSKTVWSWTGRTIEELIERGDEATNTLLLSSDYLIDGPFVEALKDPSLQWRGSSNQRVINIPKYFSK